MKRLLLLVTVLILYGSLYPWQFHARILLDNPVWMLLHAWPDPFGRSDALDAALNLALYVPFGAFCFLSLSDSWPRALASAATVIAAAALSSGVEIAQLFDAGRFTSLLDLLCNTAGAGIGIVLASAFPATISKAVNSVESAGAFRPSAAIALLYLWCGFELFPFLPLLRLNPIHSKLAAFLSPQTWPVRDAFENLCGWLALPFLIEMLAGRRKTAQLLPVALLVIPLKVFIANRNMTGYEVAGALSGIVLWAALGWSSEPKRVAALLALGALVAAGIAPFRFVSQPRHFTWIPFLPLLQAPWEAAFQILLQKSFLYGATVWLLHEGGRGWIVSSLTLAIPLALVEAAQAYLPGRTPEITDPLLAMMLGTSLMLLERREARSGTNPLHAGL